MAPCSMNPCRGMGSASALVSEPSSLCNPRGIVKASAPIFVMFGFSGQTSLGTNPTPIAEYESPSVRDEAWHDVDRVAERGKLGRAALSCFCRGGLGRIFRCTNEGFIPRAHNRLLCRSASPLLIAVVLLDGLQDQAHHDDRGNESPGQLASLSPPHDPCRRRGSANSPSIDNQHPDGHRCHRGTEADL